MGYEIRWRILQELGQGGQGKVYRVLDTHKVSHHSEIMTSIIDSIRQFSGISLEKDRREKFESFRKAVIDITRMEDPQNHGALKVLHEPKEARDPERAEARINNEIKSMAKISHPNLLKILDYDVDDRWFVSEFHPNGPLTSNRHLFTGNFASALKAFRPLVEGVAELHKKRVVHRDIKPDNVFLDANDNLVLGDFGLVFFTDQQHARISDTFENVGSRDWMPAWAMGMRIEDIRPNFDVFCLGKLLWAMVSNIPILRLWYFDRPEFNLEKMFLDDSVIRFVNPLLEKCIVEDEDACLPDASALLEEVDKMLSILEVKADTIDLKIERKCRVCGLGFYKLLVDPDITDVSERSIGLNPPIGKHRVYNCNSCGHVQWFYFRDKLLPPAWPE